MSIKPLSVPQIQQQFGTFTYSEHPTQVGQIIPDPGWAGSHLIDPMISSLKGVSTYGGQFGGRVKCHTQIAPFLKSAFEEIDRQGLTNRIIYWGGSYVPRHINHNPAKALSSHSWGIAFDLNPQWNGYNVLPPAIGKHGSIRELVPIFERFGFAWGGDFSHPDGMHFEFAKLSLLTAAPPEPLLLLIDGVKKSDVPLVRESDNRFYTIAGPLAAAMGRSLTASEADLRVPLRVIAELSGYKLKYTKDANGERIDMTSN